MATSINTLVIYTHEFPYGVKEGFIQSDLIVLSEIFQNIVIVPLGKLNGQQRSVPKNCLVIEPDFLYDKNTVFYSIRALIFSLRNSKFLNIRGVIKNYRYDVSVAKNVLKISDWIKENYCNKTHQFSYWMEDSSTALAYLKSNGLISGFFGRAHGYDIFPQRQGGRIPYRKFQNTYVDFIIFSSGDSQRFYHSEFNFPLLKTEFIPLCPVELFESPIPNDTGLITFLSCSNVVSIKRVDLILEFIRNFEMCSVKWFHIGSGPELEKLSHVLKDHPELQERIEFCGQMTSEQIRTFYKCHGIDFFLHFSESEGGIPLAIQESLSAGIPVIARGVGGLNDLKGFTGVFLINNPENSSLIMEIVNGNIENSRRVDFRMKVRSDWEDNFGISAIRKKWKSFFNK